MRRWFRGVVPAALGVTACSLTADLGGLSNGNDNGADGGAATTDAGSEAASSGGGGDASGDGAPGPFCKTLSPAPFFCADFDDGASINDWSRSVIQAPGEVILDGASFRSPPRSLLVSLPTGTRLQNGLFRDVGAHADLTLAFDVKVEEADPAGFLDLFAVRFPPGLRSIYFHVDGDFVHTTLSEQIPNDGGADTFGSHLFSKSLSLGQWARIQLHIHFGNASTASVTIDGESVFSGALDPAQVPTETMAVAAGLQYVSTAATPWTIRYDNFTVDTK